jgi:rod shape-determining protein MreC
MSLISSLFSRSWRSSHIIIIIGLIILLSVQGLGISTLVSEGVMKSFYLPFIKIKSTITDLRGVYDENQRLREQLVDANVQLSMLQEAERENNRLRAIVGFEPPIGYSLLPAKILSVTGDRIPISAVINRGSADGIMVNEPIINEEGLIGKIVSVSYSFSTVQLLTDPMSRVAVRVAESREMGIAKYLPSQGLIVDNVPSQGDVKQGDLVISSGLGGIFPPSLVVGTVIAVEKPKQEPFLIIKLAPAADFNSISELFVLRVRGR